MLESLSTQIHYSQIIAFFPVKVHYPKTKALLASVGLPLKFSDSEPVALTELDQHGVNNPRKKFEKRLVAQRGFWDALNYQVRRAYA